MSDTIDLLFLDMTTQQQGDILKQIGKPNKSKYLQLFPRSFVVSYGQALGRLTDDDILARLHEWNCEWLRRPRIAISELAETISSNLHLVEKHKNKVIAGPLATYLKDKFSPLSSALSRFDNKDRRTTPQNKISEQS